MPQLVPVLTYNLSVCQWKALPKHFGSASAIHTRFLQWEKAGFFESLWKAGLAEYDDLHGIAWRWQSIDGAMMKAPLAQEAVGPNPTDRGGNGSKRHLLVDEHDIPLSLVVTGANRHDVSQLEAVLTAIMIKKPLPPKRRSKHLCADAGYSGSPALCIIEQQGYIPHVVGRRQKAAELENEPGKKARQWVVEVTHTFYQAAGALRKAGAQLCCSQPFGCRHYRVQEGAAGGRYYLRISS